MTVSTGAGAPTELLTTIECGRPGQRYALLDGGPALDVHLAGRSATGGTGPILCGYDRFQGGFSVGGGFGPGPGITHEVCVECVDFAEGAPVRGTHAKLVEAVRA